MTTAINSEALVVVSQVCGWTYFVAWSLSFYPQVFDNWWRKSVVGLSFDFLLLNFIGHSCYLVFNCTLMWSRGVKREYHKLYPTKTTPVEINDVVFSIHAVTLTAITIFQCLIYERGKNTVSWLARIIAASLLISICVAGILSTTNVLTWLRFLYWLGYVKMIISFLKYIPQAYMNWKRQMTVGWSIGNILLDLTGGLLSFFQMFLDSINSGNWDSFKGGNAPKLGLSVLTVFFDLLFIVQHYILYRGNNKEHYAEMERIKSGEVDQLASAATNDDNDNIADDSNESLVINKQTADV